MNDDKGLVERVAKAMREYPTGKYDHANCPLRPDELGRARAAIEACGIQVLSDRIAVQDALLARVYACRMDAGEGRFVNLAKLRPVMADIAALTPQESSSNAE